MRAHKEFDVIVIGSGLSGLAAALRLKEETQDIDIAMVTKGKGATPLVAAINAALPSNSRKDSFEQYAQDMFEEGCYINDKDLVKEMTKTAPRCIKLLSKWGINFAKKNDEFLLRHASGSKYPRSLCQTSGLIGKQISSKLHNCLINNGITIFDNSSCIQLLIENDKIHGVTIIDEDSDKIENVYASVVILAWGGIGNLFSETTYPPDINGSTLAMAFEGGVPLVDLEFIEYEPLVTLFPSEAKGEPCPTAMLGEGAHLLNEKKERFMLKYYPDGEAGASKTILNKAIMEELNKGNGTVHGGVYADLRHVPLSTLKAYPWFYNRVTNAGLTLKEELLEVGPAAHSHSGGVMVNSEYETKIQGLYAVGEAMGGIHGASRLAGNAAAQALVSGVLSAESIVEKNFKHFYKIDRPSFSEQISRDKKIYNQYVPKIKNIVSETVGFMRDEKTLKTGIEKLTLILETKEVLKDELTKQIALSGLLIAKSCLLRTETRGSHNRSDYPEKDEKWQCSVVIDKLDDNKISWRKLKR